MSHIKNHFHEEINTEDTTMVDEDFRYQQWKEQQDKEIERQAEQAEFERIYMLTGTYPF